LEREGAAARGRGFPETEKSGGPVTDGRESQGTLFVYKIDVSGLRARAIPRALSRTCSMGMGTTMHGETAPCRLPNPGVATSIYNIA